jgi:hypothetical protein
MKPSLPKSSLEVNTQFLIWLLVVWTCTGTAKLHADSGPAHDIAAVNARDDLYTRGSTQQDLKLLSSVWAQTFIDTNGSGKVSNKQQMLATIAHAKANGEKILAIEGERPPH